MDPSSKPQYPMCFKADMKKMLEEYFSENIPYSIFKDTAINMIRCFYKALRSGMVSGTTLIDFTCGPTITHLLPICEFFEEISILKFCESSFKELELWKNKDPTAFNWRHIAQLSKELKGICSDESQDEEENLRKKIKQTLIWDLSKENPAEMISLPQVDCAISISCLEMISKTHEEYRTNLRKFCTVLRPGGFFLLNSTVNATYFMVGGEKYHFLPCNEEFYRKVLPEEGLEIKYCEKLTRAMQSDTVNHEGGMFIIACKANGPQNTTTSQP